MKEILKQYWGYDSFRGIQEEIIRSIGEGKDTLGLMPTGGGKSISFQVPALAKEGMCLVITPLIALMKDQVHNLRSRGIRALAIYSGMRREQILAALENAIFGNYKFLYISPERLDTDIFRTKLRRMNINLIAVDESHCISQWGYDFRPAYLKIADIRLLLPDVPILALTATATPEVVVDIQQKLGFRAENVFRMSFERKNLTYLVRKTEDKQAELLHILSRMTGCAIVYVRSRNRAKEISLLLNRTGISADYYHAGLDDVTRDQRQRRWQSDEVRVIVATNAFGMGIDKPDVRIVVHVDLPDSIEAYFQEAGRAGRDGERAYSVILYSRMDKGLLSRRISSTYPDKAYICAVYEHLQYYFEMAMGDGQGCIREFDLDEFCRRFDYFPVQVDSALKLLTQAGYIEYTEEQDSPSQLRFSVRRDDLYRIYQPDEESDRLIRLVLRMYTGLFTDAVFINEAEIAAMGNFTRDRVYDLLVRLTRQGIVRYIPRKRTPYIIYSRPRVEATRINLPPAVYEERRANYERRIRAMQEYVDSRTVCRSRLLLHYFGETDSHNCGQCDVCRNGWAEPELPDTPLTQEELTDRLLDVLADRQPHSPAELVFRLPATAQAIGDLIRHLTENGKIKMSSGMIELPIFAPRNV